MMSNLFLHPALPLLVGSILIFIVKTKVNIISIVSLIISFIFFYYYYQLAQILILYWRV